LFPAEAFKLEVYELLKPENTPLPIEASILTKYNDEVAAIFTKSLKIAEKQTLKFLETLKKQ
jgi:hypothetical protein